MGVPLPTMPTEGEPLQGTLLRFAQQVVAWMRAHTPVSSPTVRVRTSTGGTVFEAAPQGKQSNSLPASTVLYKVMAVREYDENGTLVTVGSESYPTLDTGHTLDWVEDWVRMGS